MDHEQARYKLKLNPYKEFLSLAFSLWEYTFVWILKFLSYASIFVKDLYIFWLTIGNIMGDMPWSYLFLSLGMLVYVEF